MMLCDTATEKVMLGETVPSRNRSSDLQAAWESSPSPDSLQHRQHKMPAAGLVSRRGTQVETSS
jgi:hypothetical protein